MLIREKAEGLGGKSWGAAPQRIAEYGRRRATRSPIIASVYEVLRCSRVLKLGEQVVQQSVEDVEVARVSSEPERLLYQLEPHGGSKHKEAVPACQQILHDLAILQVAVFNCVVAEIGQTDSQKFRRRVADGDEARPLVEDVPKKQT